MPIITYIEKKIYLSTYCDLVRLTNQTIYFDAG